MPRNSLTLLAIGARASAQLRRRGSRPAPHRDSLAWRRPATSGGDLSTPPLTIEACAWAATAPTSHRTRSGTYFPDDDCTFLQITGARPQSSGGQVSSGRTTPSPIQSGRLPRAHQSRPGPAQSQEVRGPTTPQTLHLFHGRNRPRPGRLLHEPRAVLAGGCAYCTNPRTPRSTPNPPPVTPDLRALRQGEAGTPVSDLARTRTNPRQRFSYRGFE